MLEELVATTFHRRMDSGRTGPLLLGGEHAEQEIEVVAKFSKGGDIGAAGLVREALCAMLAADLGLPIPQPFLVRVSQDFIESVRSADAGVADFLVASLRVGFGSKKLPEGFASWMPDRNVPRAMYCNSYDLI